MLSSVAILHLSFSFGDKENCIYGLKLCIEKYKNCKNPRSEKVLNRIQYYNNIINELTP